MEHIESAIIGRPRSRGTAHMRAIAALRRPGAKIVRQTRRCLIAKNGLASMRELRSWAYPGQPRKHSHYWSIYRALKRLGARRIGWGMYARSVP